MPCFKKKKCTIIIISPHPQAHKRRKDDEITRVRKRSAAREQGKLEAARRGNKGSSGKKRVEKLGPRGSRIRPKERAVVWSMLKAQSYPAPGTEKTVDTKKLLI